MKVLLWSAVLGSVPVCLMYLVASNRPGPGDGVFDILTVFALMPGYYCMVVVSWIVPLNRVGSKLGMAIAILFACLFWSLVVMMVWIVAQRSFGTTTPSRRKI